MQVNTQRRAQGLQDKIPDISKTLETVRFFKTRKSDAEPLETLFELNDTLYAKAIVPPTDEVYLWLGANVMLSYPLDEAVSLLESKLSTAQSSLKNCEEDLDFLREQITVSPLLVDYGRADWACRRWRSRLLEYTIGMYNRGGKNGSKEARRARKPPHRMAEIRVRYNRCTDTVVG